MTEFESQLRSLLSHHADLLRECAAAPGPCLFDHRVRCHCATEAGAGDRHLVPDRHRRARAEDRALGKARRAHADGVCDRHFGRVSRPVGQAGAQLRRLHPHHRTAPQARRAEALRNPARSRLHLQEHLHRPVLRLRRGLCRRASWHSLPDVRPHHRNRQRRELLLQALRIRAQAAGVLRSQSRFHAARVDAARSDFVCPQRAQGSVREPHQLFLGHSRPRRRKARRLCVARRAGQLHYGPRLRLG